MFNESFITTLLVQATINCSKGSHFQEHQIYGVIVAEIDQSRIQASKGLLFDISMIRAACWNVIEFALVACTIVIYLFLYLFRKAREIVVSHIFPLILKPVEKWERAFVVSCIAVSLDPLFLYIPIVDETNKCLTMDKTLRTTVLIFRSLTDILLLTHIVAQILDRVDTDYEIPPQLGYKPGSHEEFDSGAKDVSDHRFFVFSLIIKFLAVLPIPQVAILVGFFRMGGADFSIKRKFLNMSLVLQYLPRVCPIFLSRSKFSMAGKWFGAAYSSFLYIFTSHVLGALWYFFAIEREMSCWHRACEKTAGCIASAYKCGASSVSASSKNMTMLNQLCPITSPNATEFDFGIFVKVLQSGNTGSVDFPRKIFYTLWWGLKNLSNFGTSLETSSYLWENCFAILICVTGLLLFLYLIGNMQVCMLPETTDALEEYEKKKLRQVMISEKKGEIVKWMKGYELPDQTMETIKTAIRKHSVLENKLTIGVDIKYFVNDTPFSFHIKQPLLKHFGLPWLKEVPIFAEIPEEKLRDLCQRMVPVTYHMGETLCNADQPLDQMIFIIRGEIEFVGTKGPSDLRRGPKYVGKVLEEWVAFNFLIKRSYCDPLPTLPGGHVKCCNQKAEGLALNAWDVLRFAEQNFDVNALHLKKLASAYSSTVDEIKEDQLIASVPWEPPAPGWVKLNCSYVWNPDSKRAAFGCVLRNDEGKLINVASTVGSSNNLQSIDKFQAGASSITSLMKFSVQLVKTGRIIVESDDKCLIDFLDYWTSHPDDESGRGILRPVLQEVASEVKKFKGCKFAHCERQANAAAVCVAEHAVHVSDVTETKTWKKPEEIPDLVDALKKDSPHLYESLREKELVDQKVNVDSGSSTSAVGAPVSSKETIIDVKESQEA